MTSLLSKITGLLSKIDDALYRGERWVAGAMFLLMGAVMFINVVQRLYAAPDGPLSKLLLALLGGVGLSPDPQIIGGPVSLAVSIVLVLATAYIGVRTMKRKVPISKKRSLVHALAATAAAAGFVKLVLVLFPNGIHGGSAIALAAMLWVGFLGASLATYEKRHLALEMGERIWPASTLRYVKALAMLATAALTVFLLSLAVISLRLHYAAWVQNHLAGTLAGTEWPAWPVFLIFPYTFTVMAARWIAQSVRAAQGHIDEAVDSEVMAAEALVAQSQRKSDDA